MYFYKLYVYLINFEENLEIYFNGLYKLGIFFSFWILVCMGIIIVVFKFNVYCIYRIIFI